MPYSEFITRIITLLFILSMYACTDAASQAGINPEPAAKPPPTPSDFTVTVDELNGTVTLSWSDVRNTFNLDIPTYNIYWNTTSTVSQADTKVEGITSPHVVEGLVEGTVYYFVVTSEVVNLESSLSFEVNAMAPLPVLVKIDVSPKDATFANETTLQYSAIGHYSDNTTIDITSSVNWGTLDTNFTTFNTNTNGLAVAQSVGNTSITATDPISNVVGSTAVRIQLNHNIFNIPLTTCDVSGCHTTPIGHINTTVMCVSCHLDREPFKWKPKYVPNHLSLSVNCTTCHNGNLAVDKSLNHIQTTNKCNECHNPFLFSWSVSSSAVNHLEVIGVCIDCHIGTIAIARTNNHVPTSDKCISCHTTARWVPATQTDHAETIGTCISCHNGELVPGRTAAHINTSTNCDACHFDTVWIPVLPTGVDHTQVIGDTCYSCHNIVVARGKSSLHIVSSNICDDCHVILNWTTIKAPL